MKNNFLVDTNFLLALVLITHPLHEKAKAFYDQNVSRCTFLICRSVQISFLRLLTQKIDRIYKPLNNSEAIIELNKMMDMPSFLFIEDSKELLKNWFSFGKHHKASPNLWMDAYLSYFAVKNNLELLTFDKGFLQWKNKGLVVQLIK